MQQHLVCVIHKLHPLCIPQGQFADCDRQEVQLPRLSDWNLSVEPALFFVVVLASPDEQLIMGKVALGHLLEVFSLALACSCPQACVCSPACLLLVELSVVLLAEVLRSRKSWVTCHHAPF